MAHLCFCCHKCKAKAQMKIPSGQNRNCLMFTTFGVSFVFVNKCAVPFKIVVKKNQRVSL